MPPTPAPPPADPPPRPEATADRAVPEGTLYWADSELRCVRRDGADLCLHFAAAQFRPGPADPRASAGSGWLRGLVLRLHRAQWPAGMVLTDALGRIAHGRLDHLDGLAGAATTLRLPLARHTALRLTLALANGVALELTAAGLSSAADGDTAWQE